MTFKHRAIVDTIPAYKQGKPAPALAGQRSFKISSNENPYPPLPCVQKAIEDQALDRINRYPDMSGWQVVSRLAKDYEVDPAEIVLGCGSTEVITQLVDLLAGPGDEVIYPWRSFEAYPIIVAGAGATSVQIANRPDGGHDIDAMIAAINSRTRLIIVNNPNNPTSTSVSNADARRLMKAVPSDVIVLFDEAYIHFNTAADTSVAMDLYREYPNIVVAHTFSKAYGLAGLRIGYGIARADVAAGMRKMSIPFGVTQTAQVAAVASLDAKDELMKRVQALIGERGRIVKALRAQGWDFPEPYANFFWLPLGEQTAEAESRFKAAGLSTRVFDGEGIRISIGETEANDKVIEVCQSLKDDGIA
ncbi:histidinol-phosphate transaminase [Bifidobacterium sp. ESL0764]|uniref:histidinol-phosphate transaminase n=1 Tax=Bifidobacterium sp. ESL0764 TaxID=2983228 RepID=UPI0023F74272|nr:histidinol-phosphate transaminase [Bifidobacterium sp. ESL0764]WEV65495.1 histidinol-phosphate transaminase [Bifidobacterium sp. ESL0764]